jgi:hypothetical protein
LFKLIFGKNEKLELDPPPKPVIPGKVPKISPPTMQQQTTVRAEKILFDLTK